MSLGVKKIGASTTDTPIDNSLKIKVLLEKILKQLEIQTMVLNEMSDLDIRERDL